MDRNKLIEDIVQEVFKKFTQELGELPKGMFLTVIGTLTKEEKEQLQDYTLVPFTSNRPIGEKLLISEMTTSQMTRLALGYSNTPEEQVVLDALLQGKEVYLLEKGLHYKKYKETAQLQLYARYHEYESTIRQYGVRIIKSPRECVDWKNVYTPPLRQSIVTEDNRVLNKQKTHVFHKKLLLEKDLISARVGFYDILELTNHCKITPLAEDFIRAHHLTILKI